jgi:phenylpropionate dioxygenase-like ring-hydroxylating dioxygenase large terminal subunit
MRIYTDAQIFRDEIRLIFNRTWNYVAHESQLTEPGAYVTAYVGLAPVIIVRAGDGAIVALPNRCAAGAATIANRLEGTAADFRCACHGWTYDARGVRTDDVSVRITPLARVDTYRGLIFASAATDGPSLRNHLALAADAIDEWADLSPTGTVTLGGGTWKHVYRGNWKLQVEGSNEGYHPEFLHRISGVMRARVPGTIALAPWGECEADGYDLGNGHSLMEYPEFSTVHDPAYVAALSARIGPERTKRVLHRPFRLQLFPNLAISNKNLRVVRPIAVDRTEVWQYIIQLPEAPAATNLEILRAENGFYGPSGLGSADDLEIFDRIQAGCAAADHPGLDPWVWFNRGLRNERRGTRGERIAHTTSEVEQRAIYYAWSALMKGQTYVS